MSRLGLGRPLLSVFLPNGHGAMPATRKKAINMTNSCALVLSSNHKQPESTAISTAIVNNHAWYQHDKLMEAKIWLRPVITMTMPSHVLCLLSDWRRSWTGRGQFMLKKMN
jgi:hypothetical protein